MIKTEVIKYSPKAKEMALQIEKKANEMEKINSSPVQSPEAQKPS